MCLDVGETIDLRFSADQFGEAQLRVFDVNGRELLRMNNTYPAENNCETAVVGGRVRFGRAEIVFRQNKDGVAWVK